MECAARSFDQDASVKFESAMGFRNLRYATTYILDVIRCAVLSKDRSRLADVFGLALRAIVPHGALQDQLRGLLHEPCEKTIGNSSMPSAVLKHWSVSRHLLTVDAALMLAERARWGQALLEQQGCWLWWLADSSPQAKRDWLLIQSESMNQADATRLFQAHISLASCSDVDEQDALRIQAWKLIEEGLRKHVWPPGALGHGRTRMEDKLAVWIQSLWLQTGTAETLQFVLDQSVSLTPDLGTEASLPEAMEIKAESLLPPWALFDGGFVPDHGLLHADNVQELLPDNHISSLSHHPFTQVLPPCSDKVHV